MTANAQSNDLMITYDANQGVSGLAGANIVYMYSGAVTSGPAGQWEWITGSVNLNDGIGQMTPAGNNVWTICINPATYYGTALPILAIDIIFRNENGTAFGYDFNGAYVIIDMTTPVPVSSSAGVTPGICTVGFTENEMTEMAMNCYPNPMNNQTVISYNLSGFAASTSVSIFSTDGRLVFNTELYNQSSGHHQFTWTGINNAGSIINNGIYMVSIDLNGVRSTTRKLVINR
jgi:hypothetical protein